MKKRDRSAAMVAGRREPLGRGRSGVYIHTHTLTLHRRARKCSYTFARPHRSIYISTHTIRTWKKRPREKCREKVEKRVAMFPSLGDSERGVPLVRV